MRRPQAERTARTTQVDADLEDLGSPSLGSEFDRYRQTLIAKDDEEGWASELRRYLKEMPADVTKDTDIVEWWQVCSISPIVTRTLLTMGITEPLSAVPDARTHCTRYASLSSLFSPMQAPLLCKQTGC